MKAWRRQGPVVAQLGVLPRRARAFHQLLPGYAPTPLRDLPNVARTLAVGRLWLKDESGRCGLPAFKVLGGAWAVCRMCSDALGRDLSRCESWQDVLDAVEPLKPRRLVTATDGNHGRGVAHVASLLGFECTIYVPKHTVRARIDAIRSEGADVVVHNGDYDGAVERASSAAQADRAAWLVQDTAIGKREDAARWCAEGYVTLFDEIEDELARLGAPAPDVFFIQIGVGTLADAMIRCARANPRWARTKLIGVEPVDSACAVASLEAGQLRPAAHTGRETIMAGLNCASLSALAWPTLRDGLDACVAIEDAWAEEAMRLLAGAGMVAGESGASGLAGALAIVRTIEGGRLRDALGIGPSTRALVLNTEGATDPAMYGRIVGQAPSRA